MSLPPELRSFFLIRASLVRELIAYLQEYGSDEEYASGLVIELRKILKGGEGTEETPQSVAFYSCVDRSEDEEAR